MGVTYGKQIRASRRRHEDVDFRQLHPRPRTAASASDVAAAVADRSLASSSRQLVHVLFDGAREQETVHARRFRLTDSIDAFHRLRLRARVEDGLEQDDVLRLGEVQPGRAASQRHQKHARRRRRGRRRGGDEDGGDAPRELDAIEMLTAADEREAAREASDLVGFELDLAPPSPPPSPGPPAKSKKRSWFSPSKKKQRPRVGA